MSDSDAELVDRARKADASAIESLIERHLPRLHAFIRLRAGGVVRDHENVSDLVQSACREVLEDLPRHAPEGPEHFENWLYQAALRKILDRNRYWRAQRRDPAREASQSSASGEALQAYRAFLSPSAAAVSREEIERLEAAFDQLTEDQREVVLASRLLGQPHAEIARRLGRSEGATRVLLSRALARLSTLLDQD